MSEPKEPNHHDVREAYPRTKPWRRWNPQEQRRVIISLLLGIAIVYVLVFMPLPFFVFKPGTAEEIRPMVHVTQGGGDESGTFMLTTVRVLDANVVNYLYALVAPFEQLMPKTQVFRKGESEQEYSERQEYVMQDSQSNAMEAAYRRAGVPYTIKTDGVMIIQVLDNMPAAKVLQAGDYILKADDQAITETNQLLNYIMGKKAGDTIQITYKRGSVQKTEPIVLGTLPPDPTISAGSKPGLGVVPVDVRSVKADDENKQVTVKAGDIGGPSAGLMFSLEIYNQLVPEDLTKGYRIAGTGTIDPQGHVGVIGGIQHKIVAADREKADIFFAPKDLVPKQGQNFTPVLNTTDAQAQANKIHTKMKVVSVGTMDDAISYLQSLPPKNQEPSGGNTRMGD